jgi:lysozyme
MEGGTLHAVARGRHLPAAVLLAVAVTLVAPLTAVADPYGPDVAAYQHPETSQYPEGAPISWPDVAGEQDQHFAIIKATEGTDYVNTYAMSDAAAARKAGLTVGFYHFGHPEEPAVAQADFFAKTIGPMVAGELPPVLDLEITGGATPSEIVAWTKTFLARLQADTGRVPMIYTDPGFWNDSVDSTAFGSYPLWLADYTENPFAPPSAMPVGWKTYTLWQYTDNATIPGIQGEVDRDTAANAFSLDNVSRAAPNRFYVDSIALDTQGTLYQAAQEAQATAALDAGSTSRLAVAQAAVLTTAALQRDVVADYRLALHRAPDSAGENGAVGYLAKGGTPATLLEDMVASAEYYQDAGSTSEGYVKAAYETLLDRAADPAGLADNEELLAEGGTRFQVAENLSNSTEARTRDVALVYEAILRRAADPQGQSNNVAALGRNGNNLFAVMEGLFASNEYLTDIAEKGI